MILDLKVPDLGDSDKIELVEWYVKEGQSIAKGDEILELVTDKAAFPMESPAAGRMQQIIVQAGNVVKKGELLGVLELVS